MAGRVQQLVEAARGLLADPNDMDGRALFMRLAMADMGALAATIVDLAERAEAQVAGRESAWTGGVP